MQVSVALLVGRSSAPRPKRTVEGTHRHDRRDKRRNPRVGCPRIAQEIAHAFGIDIDKDVVRRVLAKHYRPEAGTDGPSWLSFIGHMKDSLWSVDLFRCELILLRSHWVMVLMDVFTRRIIGFGVERADLCGVSVCRMFNQIIAGKSLPRHLSSDHDPLFRFHRWLANLRILEVEEIKSVPYVPVSHSFVERLIGTIRREFLDHVMIWNAIDLERKLEEFRIYYNENRVHQSLSGSTPGERSGNRRLPMQFLITTLGGAIAADCSRCQSQRNYEFAMDRFVCRVWMEARSNDRVHRIETAPIGITEARGRPYSTRSANGIRHLEKPPHV